MIPVVLLLATSPAPGAPERCNGVDDDGNSLVDDPPVLWYPDDDGDGAGDRSRPTPAASCTPPAAGMVAEGGDCDDGEPLVRPGGGELCNARDDDCDGQIDEVGCACGRTQDDDSAFLVCGTLFGIWVQAQGACSNAGYDLVSIEDPAENAVLTAAMSGLAYWWTGLYDAGGGNWSWVDGTPYDPQSANWAWDQPNEPYDHDCVYIEDGTGWWYNWDCNALAPFVCEVGCQPYTTYADADGDGLGDPNTAATTCWPAAGQVFDGLDCDDGDPGVGMRIFSEDLDGDGYGVEDPALAVIACQVPAGSGPPEDCDDEARGVAPAAPEVCNGIDDDCDALADDADPDVDPGTGSAWYVDGDGDGYGAGDPVRACADPGGRADRAGDCDDADPAVHPGATDPPGDGEDRDCDGSDGQGRPDPGADSGAADGPGTDRAPPDQLGDGSASGSAGCGCGGGPGAAGWLSVLAAVVAGRRFGTKKP